MKRGQMKLSFGMIFSIILIVLFVVFAFYAIKTFIGVSDVSKVASFVDELQNEIDKVWKSTQSTQKFSYNLPSKIEKICFKDWKYENLIIIPEESVNLNPTNISHIDIKKITREDNPFCIENKEGKVVMVLSKDFDDTLVTITEDE